MPSNAALQPRHAFLDDLIIACRDSCPSILELVVSFPLEVPSDRSYVAQNKDGDVIILG
jgi:hypothetical protein